MTTNATDDPTTATVPTVPGGWLLGSARSLQRDQLGTYLWAMRTLGDHVRFRVGPPVVGFTFDAVFRPAGAHQVLGARGDEYVKQAPVFDEFAALLGDGLGSSTGERWRTHRRIIQPVFTPHHVERSTAAVATAAEELVAECRTALEPDGTIDLTGPSVRYSLRALGRTVFGDTDLADAWPVLRSALPVLSQHAARRGLAPLRIPRWWPTPANRRAGRAQRELYGVVDELIRGRRRRAGGDDLLSLLVTATDPETGEGLDDQEVRDEVLIFLTAGHETTGSSLALTLHLLARHPAVQQRVRDEVRTVLDRRLPTADDVEHLGYTTQVVREALRLYPPLHTLVRTATGPSRLLGQPLPAGRVVAVSVWGIHRNEAVWAEPDTFDPERFAEAGTHDRYAYIPFGAGPRRCIGAHLAMIELVVAVAMVVRALELRAGAGDPTLKAGLTLSPSGPLPCRGWPTGAAS